MFVHPLFLGRCDHRSTLFGLADIRHFLASCEVCLIDELAEINGTTTPSDKLPAIIEEARLRREYYLNLAYFPEDIESELDFVDYEKGVVDKVTRLFESLLHLELSNKKSSYSSEFLENHMSHLADLIKIIMTTAKRQEEEK